MIFEILAIIGFIFSLYAYYVEKRMHSSSKYDPVCNIQEHISCTRAFSSKYGHLLKISNSLLGIGYYLGIFILALLGFDLLIFLGAVGSIFMSIYLAYVSYFVQKNYCLICSGIYVVNILLLIFSYMAVF